MSVVCEFCLVFMECREIWVEWDNCTQMVASHKRTRRKQIKRGRVLVLEWNQQNLSATISNANIMYFLAENSVVVHYSWFRRLYTFTLIKVWEWNNSSSLISLFTSCCSLFRWINEGLFLCKDRNNKGRGKPWGQRLSF